MIIWQTNQQANTNASQAWLAWTGRWRYLVLLLYRLCSVQLGKATVLQKYYGDAAKYSVQPEVPASAFA